MEIRTGVGFTKAILNLNLTLIKFKSNPHSRTLLIIS